VLSATWGRAVGLQRDNENSATMAGRKQRLEVPRQYAVLDTPPEKALDTLITLTALAAQICGARQLSSSLPKERP